MSRRVALIAIDPTWEDPTLLSFSYAIRKLEASLLSASDLGDVEVKVIDLPSRDLEHFFDEITAFQPTLVGASLYLWSILPFQSLARRLKAWSPDLPIIAGGPQARESVFALAPYRSFGKYVDAVVTGEGEQILRDIVRLLPSSEWKKLPGLLVPHPLGWRSTGPLERIELDAYPSPYHIDSAPRGLSGHLETYRGCPIHCTFCQWGDQRADRVHSVEYLTEQLLGLRRAEVPNVFCLDAAYNLSPRAFRNLAAAEKATKVLSERLVMGHIYPTFLRDEHLELLTSFGQPQVNIGIQSFDPEVLHKLGRPFDLERFDRVVEAIRPHFPIDLEIMLGLPGDTPESFKRTFHRAIEIGDSVQVFWTLVLPDALLDRAEPSMAIEFDPETWLLRSCLGWSPDDLRDTLEYCKKEALRHERQWLGDSYCGFDTRKRERGTRAADRGPIEIRVDLPVERGVTHVPIELVEDLRQRVATTVLGWRLRTVRNRMDGLFFDLDSPSGHLVLEAVPEEPSRRFFVSLDQVAYSYRGALSRDENEGLKQVIHLVHSDARGLVNEPRAPAA